MEEKIVLTEKEKKHAYNQIYKNFWNIIYYSGVIGQGEMDMLKNLIVNYFGIKHDFAVPVEFVEGITSNGYYLKLEQRIDVNTKLTRASKDAVASLENIDKLLTNLHHEFSHFQDHMENELRQSGRTFIAGKWRSLLRILESAGCSNSSVYDVCKTFYEVSRSEVFARQKSFIEALGFVNNVEKFAFETLSTLKIKNIISKKDYDLNFEKCLIQTLTEEDYNFLHGLEVLRIIKTSIQNKQQKEAEILRFYKLKKAYFLPDLKMIFEEEALQFFDKASKGIRLKGFVVDDIQNILEIDGFYDEKIAHSLYEFAKENNNLSILGRLAQNSNFPMSEQERLKYKEVKTKEKNPIEKLDVIKGYTAYKTRKLKQNNMEKQ